MRNHTFKAMATGLLGLAVSACLAADREPEGAVRVEPAEGLGTYVVEPDGSPAGSLPAQERRALSRKPCDPLPELGKDVEWVQSYVFNDKVYCVYRTPSEQLFLP